MHQRTGCPEAIKIVVVTVSLWCTIVCSMLTSLLNNFVRLCINQLRQSVQSNEGIFLLEGWNCDIQVL